MVLSLWRALTTTPSAFPEPGLYDLIWQRDFEDVISEGFRDGEITLDYWGGPQMKEQEGQREDATAWEAGVGMGGARHGWCPQKLEEVGTGAPRPPGRPSVPVSEAHAGLPTPKGRGRESVLLQPRRRGCLLRLQEETETVPVRMTQ